MVFGQVVLVFANYRLMAFIDCCFYLKCYSISFTLIEQSRIASFRQTNVVPVVVIGVVVSVVAIFIVVVTVCLVCRHRRQNAAESPRTETPGVEEKVGV